MQSGSQFSYEDRYGVRPAKRWVLPATVIAAIGISWLVWVGLHHSNPDIRSSVISFTATTDREMSIRYEVVRKDKDQVLTCTLVARDYDKTVVGQIEDEIGPGLAVVQKNTEIPTRSQGVNADVVACRIK
ncbi:Protein of unknown function DUF4307 [Candidatus Planktophila vernalis]|jgi:hypothetical protein|uniref:DUF4307 domain-containing protein n=1 Tax=Candidatus Planktophila vernalis TaxID=1884907 RepID=UPI000BACB53B|nr:DUF4307 domain-containing protein [Candidatus Planktophila vernalis]